MLSRRVGSLLSPVLFLCLTTVYAQDGGAVATLVHRARMLDAQGRHDLAAENWKQVLLLDPRQPEGLEALANYYHANGNTQQERYYRNLLTAAQPGWTEKQADGASAGVKSNQGRLHEAATLAAAHKYAEALAIYREVFGATPPDNWAVAYYQTEAAVPSESQKGIEGLRALVQKYPANPTYQLALAQQLSYEPATRPEALRMFAAFRGSPAQNDQARAAWRAALLWSPDAREAQESAKAYLARYSDPELERKLSGAPSKVVRAAADSPEEGAGYAALSQGKLADAAGHFQAMVKDPQFTARGELGLGYVSMQQNDFAAAVQHFEEAHAHGLRTAKLQEALAEARYWKAMSDGNQALRAQNPAQAAEAFAHARELDPRRPEAAEALAGALLAAGRSEEAEQAFAADAKANPNRPEAWIGWMNALLDAGKFERVVRIQQDVPAAVRVQLVHRSDYLAMLLCAELAQGNDADARLLRARLTQADPAAAQADDALQAPRLLFRYGYFEDAARVAGAALKRDMSNADAWQVLIEAEHGADRDATALTFASRMPRAVEDAAMRKPAFLVTLAAIYQNENELDSARTFLDRAERLSTAADRATILALQMQKASLAQAEEKPEAAYNIYRTITEKAPDNVDAWIGMFGALHAAKRDADALDAMRDLPPDLSEKLRHNPAFLQVAGFVYSNTGHAREGLLCLHAVTDYYARRRQAIPFGAGIELAWLQLQEGEYHGLATTLNELGQRRNLSLAQDASIQKVWSAWSVRRAEQAFASGQPQLATQVLETALRAYPADADLRVELAGMYVRTGRAGTGEKLLKDMNWSNASVGQFAAGINAALACQKLNDAQYWLYLGLEKYPKSVELLKAAAHLEERKGDIRKAQKYLEMAAAVEEPVLPAQAQPTSSEQAAAPGATESQAPATTLEHLLDDAGADSPEPAREDAASDGVAMQTPATGPQSEDTAPLRFDDSQAVATTRVGKSAYAGQRKPAMMAVAADTTVLAAPPATSSDDSGVQRPSTARHSADRPQAEAIADPLQGRDLGLSGYSPENSDAGSARASLSLKELLQPDDASSASGIPLAAAMLGVPGNPPPGAEGSVSSSAAANAAGVPAMKRAAQPAAEQELADLQAQYSPWLIAGGLVQNHSGTAGFDQLADYEGELAGSTIFGIGSARLSVVTRPVMLQSGVPDSTSNYRFGSGGTLPADTQFASGMEAQVQFVTHTLQASAGTSPAGFPVQNMIGSLAYRPFAGPFTFRLYRAPQKDSLLSYAGMQDPATGQIWGGVVATGGALEFSRGSAASGFYASFDGQQLTGRNVTDNSRIMGNAGAYWLAFSNPFGDLKIGANLTAMHYARNERYFTIGQGGYFSPDAFLLMNAPISWEGRPARNTSYSIGGSFGAQSVQQAAAMPGSLLIGSGLETTTGASYDFHLKVAHQMDSHWTLEGFLDANNARQYRDTTAGFIVRYAQRPQPMERTGPGLMNIMDPLPLQLP